MGDTSCCDGTTALHRGAKGANMTAVDDQLSAAGQARCPAPTVQDYLDRDSQPVPVALRRDSYVYLGSDDIPKHRYTSRHFHDLEIEKMWSRTWQICCREEDVARPGDTVVYDLADTSIVVVRTDHGRIKA